MASWFDENNDEYSTQPVREEAPVAAEAVNPHIEAAKAAGLSQDTINDFLARNPGDAHRLLSAYDNEHGPDDPAPASSGMTLASMSGGPRAISPYTRQFVAPTMEQVQSSPGFQFRLGEGMKALERSAAAKGTLLTGATGKSLAQFGQDYASNEYDKAYGRAVGEFQQDFGVHQWNEGNRFSSERTNRMDSHGIDQDLWGRGQADKRWAFEQDQALWGRKNLEEDQRYNRYFKLADFGYNAARSNPAY
jgi:hypothetical protein